MELFNYNTTTTNNNNNNNNNNNDKHKYVMFVSTRTKRLPCFKARTNKIPPRVLLCTRRDINYVRFVALTPRILRSTAQSTSTLFSSNNACLFILSGILTCFYQSSKPIVFNPCC